MHNAWCAPEHEPEDNFWHCVPIDLYAQLNLQVPVIAGALFRKDLQCFLWFLSQGNKNIELRKRKPDYRPYDEPDVDEYGKVGASWAFELFGNGQLSVASHIVLTPGDFTAHS